MVAEINIMWAAHQVHHSSEDYNFTTALRQSVVQNYTSAVSIVSHGCPENLLNEIIQISVVSLK